MNPFFRHIAFRFMPGMLCLFAILSCTAQTDSPYLPFNSFKADFINKNTVQLKWGVAPVEKDSVQFVIERSTDGIIFQPLPKSPSSIIQTAAGFQYTDQSSFMDSVFYRITRLVEDGKEILSDVRKVYPPEKIKTEIVIMPNPVFNNASLIINDEGMGDISCTLYDMTGKNIRSYQLKKTTVYLQQILDMYSVPKGEYILSIRGTTINEVKRILKQ